MCDKPPVLILSGFLGSGKTTVLLQLIGHARAKFGDDFRIAIIENEIGSASIDSGVIGQAGYSVTELLSGCVCCTLLGQLVPSIEKLTEELKPQLVILEATGMATPGSLHDNIEKYGGNPTRVVSLADASRWQRIKLALWNLLEAQIEPADVVCINKVDLADEEAIADVEQTVRDVNASATLIRVSAASPIAGADLDLMLGV